MNILITGGLGYVGLTLINHLIQKTSYNIRVVDLNIYKTAELCFHLLEKNKDRFELIIDDLRICNLDIVLKDIDYVVHLASLVGEDVCKLNPEEAKGINYHATVRLIQKCEELQIKRFIFASTCSNYGISEELATEQSKLNPLSLYSSTKIDIEYFLLQKVNNLPFTICRFATAFGIGPRFRSDLMIHEFINDAIQKGEITLFGCEAWRPFIHVIDMARAIVLIMKKETETNSVYNIGSNDNNIQKITLAEMISNHTQCKITCPDKESKDKRDYRVDFSKFYDKLGFTTNHKIKDSIPNLVSLWRNGLNVHHHNRITLDHIKIKRFENPKTFVLNGCFVNEEKKLCFINIHKNASKSMRNAIRGTYCIYDHSKYSSYTKICILRNPIERFVSVYQYLLQLEDNGYLNEHPTYLTAQSEFYSLRDKPIDSFLSFLNAVEGENFFDTVLYSQTQFLSDHNLTISDIDSVFILEDIDRPFREFALKYDLDCVEFPYKNKGNPEISELLTNYIYDNSDILHKIKQLYCDDINIYEKYIGCIPQIEELCLDDWESYLELINQLYPNHEIKFSYENFRKKYDDIRSQRSIIYVIKNRNRLIGTARIIILNKMYDPSCLIEDVVVDINHRHQKYATKLIRYIFKKAKEFGCYKIVTYTRDETTPFYLSIGMSLTGKSLTYHI